MQVPLVKVFGERNTGTNYLSELLNLNLAVHELPGTVPYPVFMAQKMVPGSEELLRDLYFRFTFNRNFGWKHTLISDLASALEEDAPDDIFFVSITKNPYSWLLSLHRRPYHQEQLTALSFEEFIRTPWHTVGRENAPAVVSNPIELWNMKNGAYVALNKKASAINITFENLLKDPEKMLKQISQRFDFGWKVGQFENFDESTKKETTAKDSEFYRNYYLQEKWKSNLSCSAIEFINARLDPQLMDYFGYEWL